MSNEIHPLFPLQKSEVVVGGSVVFAVLFVGLISLRQSLALFGDPPCDDVFFRTVPFVTAGSFLFAIFWATTGLIRFVGNRTFIFAGDLLPRSTHLAFLLPLLTILAILAGVTGFIGVGIISVVLLITSYCGSQASPPNNILVVVGNIVLSFIAFGLTVFLLFLAASMCAFAHF